MKNHATIKIKGLRIKTIIGCNEIERTNKQEILLDITIKYNDQAASNNDDLQYALNYDTLIKKLSKEIEETAFFLLEKLSDFVIEKLISYKQINYVKVKIKKPDIFDNVDYISVQKKYKRDKNGNQ